MGIKKEEPSRGFIPLSELSERDIIPGTVIEGIKTFDELDVLIKALAAGLTAANNTEGVPFASILKKARLDRFREEFINQGKRRHFNGSLSDFKITVIQFDSIPNNPDLKGSLGKRRYHLPFHHLRGDKKMTPWDFSSLNLTVNS